MIKRKSIVIAMIIVLLYFAVFIIYNKKMIKELNQYNVYNYIKKLNYSMHKVTKESNNNSEIKYNISSGYFDHEIVPASYGDSNEHYLKKYDDNNNLIWSVNVLSNMSTGFLKIDEENKRAYVIGWDQYEMHNTIKSIDFDGLEMFSIVMGFAKTFQDFIISEDSFTIIYSYYHLLSGYHLEESRYYQIEYSNDGTIIKDESLFEIAVEYLAYDNSRVFAYDNKNNILLIKELNTNETLEINIKNYIPDIKNTNIHNGFPIAQTIDNKLIFFTQIKPLNYAIIAYDYIENILYWTDIIKELSDKFLYAQNFSITNNGELIIHISDSERYLINIDL